MARKPGHQCECVSCQTGQDQPLQDDHKQLNALIDRMDERQLRWVAGREAMKLGHGGITRVAEITGLHHETIRRGRDEIQQGLEHQPDGRIRREGGGRPRVEKKVPPSSVTC